MRTRPLLAPGQAVDSPLDGTLQQPVPRRIELDLVDAVTEAVVGAENRQVALGPQAVIARLWTAGHRPSLMRSVDPPTAALSLEGLAQRQVRLEQIDGLQRPRLIAHLTSRIGYVDSGHGVSSRLL